MSRHLMAKFRREAADDGWQRGTVLPHTLDSMRHFDRHHGGSGSLPMESDQLHTKIVNHGETRYGLQVMDSGDGWSEWSIHRQVGPDIDDPDHWERMGAPHGAQPYCNCVGDGPDEHELDFPLGAEEGWAGHSDATPYEDPSGVEAGKAAVEKAFEEKVASRGHGLGDHDYDHLVRGLDEPEGGYDIFGDHTAARKPQLDFPWMLHEHAENGNETWHAPLENGHRLTVFDTSENEPYWGELEPGSYQMGMVPADEPQSHWKGGYHLGLDHPDAGDPEAFAAAGYPDDWHAPWKAVYDPRSTLRGKAYPSRERAMLAVERAYKQHIKKHMLTQRAQEPRQSPPPAAPVDFDDYDYGDIFGEGR